MRSFRAGKSQHGRQADPRAQVWKSEGARAARRRQVPKVTRPSGSIRQAGFQAISQAWASGSAT